VRRKQQILKNSLPWDNNLYIYLFYISSSSPFSFFLFFLYVLFIVHFILCYFILFYFILSYLTNSLLSYYLINLFNRDLNIFKKNQHNNTIKLKRELSEVIICDIYIQNHISGIIIQVTSDIRI